MKINVLFFGSLADAMNGQSEIWLEGVRDIDTVKNKLLEINPQLSEYTFRIALNQRILEGNQNLKDNDVVALLPPFAGG